MRRHLTLNRRQFISTTAAAGIATYTAPFVHANSKGDKKHRTALIGCGWWGTNILREAIAAEQSSVVALCDVDQDNLDICLERVEELTGDAPETFADYRECLAQSKPEIVIVATPDHWHALIGIAAMEAGAHVFIEKPTGHTIQESRALVNTSRSTDRMVQVGLHRRIGPHHRSGMDFLKSGAVGKIGMVRMFAHGGGGAESPTANGEPPEGLDWDMYCGPAPLRPFNRKIHPGGFRNFLDFANGTLGDWGVHWLDQVLWWSEGQVPRRIYSTGSRHIKGDPVLSDTEQTTDAPDAQIAVYDFDSFTAVWEHRRFAGNDAEKHKIGCYFYGTKGTFHMGWRDGWTFYPANSASKPVHEAAQLQEPDGHNIRLLWADFLSSLQSGKHPVADVEIGHQATSLSLLGMLSYKLGRSVRWDGEKERIIGDDAANGLLRREYRAPWTYPTV
jgi:predicted dehydrogenase